MLSDKRSYEDYKYVMADTAFVYVGAKYTYEELLEAEEVPFKLRTVAERYLMPGLDPDTSLESHFYYMTASESACRIYRQLKVKVKVSRLKEKKGFPGRPGAGKRVYVTENIPLERLVEMTPAQKEQEGILIQEIIVSKLALMTFTV